MQAGPIMQLPVFLILFFAPVYVPLALLAGWVSHVAKFNPLTLILNTNRDLLAGLSAEILAAYGVAFALVGAARHLGGQRHASRRGGGLDGAPNS